MKRHNTRIIIGCLLGIAFSLLPRSGRAQTGEVLGTGYNAFGQIGDGTTINRKLPTPALHISGIKAIACGYFHTLALDARGQVWAWGGNFHGQVRHVH